MQDESSKANPFLGADPVRIGTVALSCVFIALFFFGKIFSLVAVLNGFFGLYLSFVKKASKKAYVLNILAILLGLALTFVIISL